MFSRDAIAERLAPQRSAIASRLNKGNSFIPSIAG